MSAAIETFKQLQDRVLSWMSDQGNTGLIRTLVQDAIRASHETRLTKETWQFMRWPRTELFSLVQGRKRYSLHELWLFPRHFRSRTTGTDLVEVQDANFLESYEDHDETGDVLQFVYSGRSRFLGQPDSATSLLIANNNASDNGKKVLVRGISNAGVQVEEEVTLATSVFTSTSYIEMTDFVKVDASWLGSVTVSANAVTILELPAAEFGKSFQQIEFLVAPTRTEEVEYTFYRQPKRLTLDNDTLDIPPPFTHLVVYDSLLDLVGYTRATAAEVQRWQNNVRELELGMQQTFLEGHTLGAAPRSTVYIPRY